MLPLDITGQTHAPIPATGQQYEVVLRRQLEERIAVSVFHVEEFHSLDRCPLWYSVGHDQLRGLRRDHDAQIIHAIFDVFRGLDESLDVGRHVHGLGPRSCQLLSVVPCIAADIEQVPVSVADNQVRGVHNVFVVASLDGLEHRVAINRDE